MHSGLRNSSNSISPGWVGGRFSGSLPLVKDESPAFPVAPLLRLVVVRDLNFVCISVLPVEADAILFVDPYAVLTSPVTPQRLQFVPRRYGQVSDDRNPIELVQLPLSHSPEGLGADFSCRWGVQTVEDVLRTPIVKGRYHVSRYTV